MEVVAMAHLASLGEGGVHSQTKFGFQAAVSAALANWFRCRSSWRQAVASPLRCARSVGSLGS